MSKNKAVETAVQANLPGPGPGPGPDPSMGGTFHYDKHGNLLKHTAPTKDGVRAGDPLQAIKAAIRGLDKANAELWTSEGVPRVDAIEAVLNEEITKTQRDSAWAAIKE